MNSSSPTTDSEMKKEFEEFWLVNQEINAGAIVSVPLYKIWNWIETIYKPTIRKEMVGRVNDFYMKQHKNKLRAWNIILDDVIKLLTEK